MLDKLKELKVKLLFLNQIEIYYWEIRTFPLLSFIF